MINQKVKKSKSYDSDLILTAKEKIVLKETIKEYKAGKTTKLEDLEKELKL